MSTQQAQIEGTIQTVEGLCDQLVRYTGGRIDQANEALDFEIYTLKRITDLQVAIIEVRLVRHVSLIAYNAEYHILRAYWHASPSFMAVLAAIWAVILIVWTVVKNILAVVQVIQELRIDDLLASFWPAFREARDKFRKWVGELSDALGWGVDGFLHLLHASQGFTDVIGGLSGKSITWMDAQWMNKTGRVLEGIKAHTDVISAEPGRVIEGLFQWELIDSFFIAEDFGKKFLGDISEGLDRGAKALTGLAGVADELSAIQENMPEIVRNAIPAAIWDGLETFSSVVEEEILPRIRTAEQIIDQVDSMLKTHQTKLALLASHIALPGTMLLNIDDLPEFMRTGEYMRVDYAASKTFEAQTDAERAAMSGDLNAFAIIDRAVSSPLPALGFMTIEDPGRAKIYGIVATPQETWFVGGYSSKY